jgi:putative membrane protein insertion efficiency factor
MSEREAVAPLLGVVVRLPRRAIVLLLRGYQRYISPLTPPTCRYYPSCSQYAVIAIQRHGVVWGTWLAARRLLRCHPWAAGGVDDVPEAGWRWAPGHQHSVVAAETVSGPDSSVSGHVPETVPDYPTSSGTH